MKSQKVHPSLINLETLPWRKFKTIQERNLYIVAKRQEGFTLREIGKSLNLTRERIRQINSMLNGPSRSEVESIRINKYKEEIIALLRRNPNFDRLQLAKELDISLEKLKISLGSDVRKIASNTKLHHLRQYSDSQLLEILKNAKLDSNGQLSATFFTNNGGKPTIAVFITRFGSWSKSCELAGISSGTGRKAYIRKHSESDLLNFVSSYLADPRTNGTAKGYDQWQRNIDGAPSLALIRQRLGKWNDIKKRLIKNL